MDEILPQDIHEFIRTVGPSGTFPHKDGYKVVIKDGNIVTIKS